MSVSFRIILSQASEILIYSHLPIFYRRRIDLLSKLLSPLFVSLLTTSISYKLSAVILLSICLFSTGFELWFVGTVHDRFSTLQEAEIKAKERDRAARAQELQVSSSNGSAVEMQAVGQNQTSKIPSENRTKTTIEVGKLLRVRLRSLTRFFKNWVRMEASDWKEFAAMPVFISEFEPCFRKCCYLFSALTEVNSPPLHSTSLSLSLQAQFRSHSCI